MKKLKALFSEFKRYWGFKLVIALCLGLAYCLFAYRDSALTAVTYLSLNYPKALEGQYLNGTRLNMYDVLSDDILMRAIEKAGLEDVLTPEALSEMLTISPRHSSTPEKKYIATEFEIDLAMKERLLGVDADGLLRMVCMAFVETFFGTHASNHTALDFSLDALDEMDYDEIGVTLRTKVDLIIDYVDYRYNSQPDFTSAETGESFSSLRQKVYDFYNIVLENYDAYVMNNGVTKDLDQLQSTLDYEQVLLWKTYDTHMAKYDARLKAIGAYDAIQSAIVMIPTMDAAGEFYMSKTKIGIDYLAEDADEAMNMAKDVKREIDGNETRRTMAVSSTQSARTMTALRAEVMIEEILSALENLEQLVIKTDDDYVRQETAKSLIYRMRGRGDTELFDVKNTLIVVLLAYLFLTVFKWPLAGITKTRRRIAGWRDA